MSNRNNGFTLIELIMTIVLLGILAATAIPRFADLTSESEGAVFEGVKSNFKVGIRLVKSKSLVNRTGATYPDVNLEGQCIQVNPTSGYPEIEQTTGTCSAVAGISPLKYEVWPESAIQRAIVSLDGPPSIFTAANAAPPPPPPPPPPTGSDELPELLMEGDFTDWVWSKTAPNGTLTSPEGLSFVYNQDNGSVN